jgi:hypothetical protein
VLARAVDARERLLVQQAHESVAQRDRAQHLHREHVVVDGDVARSKIGASSYWPGATSLWRVFAGTPSFHSSRSTSCMNASTRG